ncbi:hypothetical protein LJC02_01825 [Breznakia sp. OttesenSCG-928-G09]|nr:hypothetical protein [Breznakia sp. OttesenSCG-928-G09]
MKQVCDILNRIQALEYDLMHAEHDDERKVIYFELDRMKRQLEKARGC